MWSITYQGLINSLNQVPFLKELAIDLYGTSMANNNLKELYYIVIKL